MDSLRPASVHVACRTASAEKPAKTLRIGRGWNCGLHGAAPGRLAICNRGRALGRSGRGSLTRCGVESPRTAAGTKRSDSCRQRIRDGEDRYLRGRRLPVITGLTTGTSVRHQHDDEGGRDRAENVERQPRHPCLDLVEHEGTLVREG